MFDSFCSRIRLLSTTAGLVLVMMLFAGGDIALGEETMIYPVAPLSADVQTDMFDQSLLGDGPLDLPVMLSEFVLEEKGFEGKAAFRVDSQQAALKIAKPVFVTPATLVSWSWKKEAGDICVIQLAVVNTETNQQRYLGYGAGVLTEGVSADPTIEILVAIEPPRQWTRVERNLADDIHKVLGWDSAKVTEIYFSPWDGAPGLFADASLKHVASVDYSQIRKLQELEQLSIIGLGNYVPSQIKAYDGQHVETFQASFEECAPGRNSGANEWSAFGAIGNLDFNAMGREMRVRYPACDLVFRLYEDGREIEPGALDSFRLGLVNDRLPAIWGGWQYGGLVYKVSAMTIPSPNQGNYDLFKLEIQNPTAAPLQSQLVAGIDGSPDLRLENGVVRGQGDAPLVIADAPARQEMMQRDYGLCDKRAKGYVTGQPSGGEESLSRSRVGLDGLPVVYRFKAESGKRYTVYLAATAHLGGYYIEQPKEEGDLIFEYKVEGAAPGRLDPIEVTREKDQPLCIGFEGCRDEDGDGYIEVVSGVASDSKIRQTCLGAIYVFPDGQTITSTEAVYSGAMNAQCVWHIDVGLTPEQWWSNQRYDFGDVGLARLKLGYGETIQSGEIKTYWLKVPPIHRRESASMGNIAHAFRDVMPGEAVPSFGEDKVASLKKTDPSEAERQLVNYWDKFFAEAAQFNVPDPVLNDIYLSRLATRAILDVPINKDVAYNTCSPFFYFDHAYRDQAYVIYALDLAGLHGRAEHLLKAYCMNLADIKDRGGISFDGKPLQLGMLDSGLWYTRPGQYDTQGENIWCLVQHYKLSGDRDWLEKTAYPFIRRGAMWIVNSRHTHMEQVKDPEDPRYGLIEPGGMEVLEVGEGMHMYYMNAFAILGLRETADAAKALGNMEDYDLFMKEYADLKASLHKSFAKTFKRTGLYEGNLWFGVEPEGVGMYGFWAHNCLLWPCRSVEPFDPMWTATLRRMEEMANKWGGGMHSEGEGSYWPYIGVDRAVGYILRGEPDRALDYFCAFTDTAGGTFSWGEGYSNVIAMGDQPHFWADGQWLNIYRQLFAFEDGSTLMITPAIFRRWHKDGQTFSVKGLPTHFGDLDLEIQANKDGDRIDYRVKLEPKGDQAARPLEKMILCVRSADGQAITGVTLNGQPWPNFTRDQVILPNPAHGTEMNIRVDTQPI